MCAGGQCIALCPFVPAVNDAAWYLIGHSKGWSLCGLHKCGCAVPKVALMQLRILYALFCTDQHQYRSRMVKFARLLAQLLFYN